MSRKANAVRPVSALLAADEEQQGKQKQRRALQYDTPAHQDVRSLRIVVLLAEVDDPGEQDPERPQESKAEEDDKKHLHG